MFKNKLLFLSPVIALLVVLFFINAISNCSTAAENLPIAIVNEDQGVEIPNQPKMNMGQTIVDNMKKQRNQRKNPQ